MLHNSHMTSLVLCECYTSLIIRGVPLFGCCMLLQVPIVGSCYILGVLYVIVITACCTPSLLYTICGFLFLECVGVSEYANVTSKYGLFVRYIFLTYWKF